MRNLLLIPALAAAALAACAREQGPPTVEALDPWCRPAAEGALTAACYLTLTASADDRLVSVTTPAAERAEVHTMSMDGGVMRMRHLTEGLALPRNRATALSSGGDHLMLISPRAALAEGGTVDLTLTFEKAAPIQITARVSRAPVG